HRSTCAASQEQALTALSHRRHGRGDGTAARAVLTAARTVVARGERYGVRDSTCETCVRRARHEHLQSRDGRLCGAARVVPCAAAHLAAAGYSRTAQRRAHLPADTDDHSHGTLTG